MKKWVIFLGGLAVVLSLIVAIYVMVSLNEESHGAYYRVIDQSGSVAGLWSTYYSDNVDIALGSPTVLHGYWMWRRWHDGTLVIPASHTIMISALK
jgi:hypothetical protein